MLHLFVAFRDKNEAIGLDILEGLAQINEKLGLNNFKLHVRLSSGEVEAYKFPRWSDKLIEDQFTDY